jgi:predicted nuclease of predicted toxin-antitoxin system
MRLLFDQNLSHKLVDRLSDIFPGSVHVLALRFILGTEQVRMVWVRLGNGSTAQVEAALRERRQSIEALAGDPSQVIENF